LAQCHGSDLLPLRLPFAYKPAVSLAEIAGIPEVLTSPAETSLTSQIENSYCRTFRWVSLARSKATPESLDLCWNVVATVYPLGNCDSLRPETSLSYSTRIRAASHCSFPLSSLFAFLDGTRLPPEELVNYASSDRPEGQTKRGWANQPAPTIAQSPGVILRRRELFIPSSRQRMYSYSNLSKFISFFLQKKI